MLLTRDHQDLGSCLCEIPLVGMAQHFQRVNPEPDTEKRRIDDTETAYITWPNYHSGRNGDAQRISALEPLSPLMQRTTGGPLEWLPAHPHEGAVSAPRALGGSARVVARGCSAMTGTEFNLVVSIEGGDETGGGRVVADSSFHHFCDCNWDPSAGAPSFVDEPWGDGMQRSPDGQADVRRYVENVAAWLAAGR